MTTGNERDPYLVQMPQEFANDVARRSAFWEEEAKRYARNAEFWRGQHRDAISALKAAAPALTWAVRKFEVEGYDGIEKFVAVLAQCMAALPNEALAVAVGTSPSPSDQLRAAASGSVPDTQPVTCGSHENTSLQSVLPIIGRWNGEGPMPHRWIDDNGAIHYRSYEDYCFDGEPEKKDIILPSPLLPNTSEESAT